MGVTLLTVFFLTLPHLFFCADGIAETFGGEINPVCFVHNDFGYSPARSPLNMLNLDVQITKDRGILLNGTYYSEESAPTTFKRYKAFADQVFAKLKGNLQTRFLDECAKKRDEAYPVYYFNFTITAEIQVLTSPVMSSTTRDFISDLKCDGGKTYVPKDQTIDVHMYQRMENGTVQECEFKNDNFSCHGEGGKLLRDGISWFNVSATQDFQGCKKQDPARRFDMLTADQVYESLGLSLETVPWAVFSTNDPKTHGVRWSAIKQDGDRLDAHLFKRLITKGINYNETEHGPCNITSLFGMYPMCKNVSSCISTGSCTWDNATIADTMGCIWLNESDTIIINQTSSSSAVSCIHTYGAGFFAGGLYPEDYKYQFQFKNHAQSKHIDMNKTNFPSFCTDFFNMMHISKIFEQKWATIDAKLVEQVVNGSHCDLSTVLDLLTLQLLNATSGAKDFIKKLQNKYDTYSETQKDLNATDEVSQVIEKITFAQCQKKELISMTSSSSFHKNRQKRSLEIEEIVDHSDDYMACTMLGGTDCRHDRGKARHKRAPPLPPRPPGLPTIVIGMGPGSDGEHLYEEVVHQGHLSAGDSFHHHQSFGSGEDIYSLAGRSPSPTTIQSQPFDRPEWGGRPVIRTQLSAATSSGSSGIGSMSSGGAFSGGSSSISSGGARYDGGGGGYANPRDMVGGGDIYSNPKDSIPYSGIGRGGGGGIYSDPFDPTENLYAQPFRGRGGGGVGSQAVIKSQPFSSGSGMMSGGGDSIYSVSSRPVSPTNLAVPGGGSPYSTPSGSPSNTPSSSPNQRRKLGSNRGSPHGAPIEMKYPESQGGSRPYTSTVLGGSDYEDVGRMGQNGAPYIPPKPTSNLLNKLENRKPLPPTPPGGCGGGGRMKRASESCRLTYGDGNAFSGGRGRGRSRSVGDDTMYANGGEFEMGDMDGPPGRPAPRRPPPPPPSGPYQALDPDGDGYYGIGPAGESRGEHIKVEKQKAGMDPSKAFFVGMIMQSMSQSMSMANSRAVDNFVGGKYDHMDKDQAIAIVVVEKLNEMGGQIAQMGTMAAMMGAGPAGLVVAAAGMAMQMAAGFVTFAFQIHALRYPQDKPVDPLLSKYQQYQQLMSSDAAGNRWCLGPESNVEVALPFFGQSPHKDSEKTLTFWASSRGTRIKVFYNPLVMLNFQLTIKCGGGVLRFEQFNSRSVAITITQTSEGITISKVTQLSNMISQHEIVEAGCDGNNTLILERDTVPSERLVLLKKRGPGEPPGTEEMATNVCDEFPWKKFYVAIPACSYDTNSITHGWSSCSVMFRNSIWNSVNNSWVAANPFTSRDSDRKLFEFKKRDFRTSNTIRPNTNNLDRQLCSNADTQSSCRLPDILVPVDTSDCNNKLRWFRVELAPLFDMNDATAMQAYMLVCPPQTLARHIVKRGKESQINVVTLDVYGSVAQVSLNVEKDVPSPIAWLFCQHMTDIKKVSDVIEITLSDRNDVSYGNSVNTSSPIFSPKNTQFDMPKISQRGPFTMKAWRGEKFTVKKKTDLKNFKYIKEAVAMVPGGKVTDRFRAGLVFNAEWDLTDIEEHWISGGANWWGFARKGCKATSAMQVTLSACTISHNTGMIKNKILGFGTWTWLTQTKDPSQTTRTMATDAWLFSRYGVENDDLFEKCIITLSLTTKMLKIQCTQTRIFSETLVDYDHICLAVSSARDQCNHDVVACGTIASEWLDMSIKKEKWADATSYQSDMWWADGSEMMIPYGFFCADQGVYTAQYDATNRYAVTVIARPLDSTPPVIPSYQSGNSIGPNDRLITAEQFKKIEVVQDKISKLYDIQKQQNVIALNEFSAGLTSESRDVVNVLVSAGEVTKLKTARDDKIDQLKKELEDVTLDLMADAITGTEWYNFHINMSYHKCCKLSFKDENFTLAVEKSFPDFEHFNCPDAKAFYKDSDVKSHILLGPESIYTRDSRIKKFLDGRPELNGVWQICLDTQELIFEDEEALEAFNATLLEKVTDVIVKDRQAFVADSMTTLLRLVDDNDDALPDLGVVEALVFNPEYEIGVSKDGTRVTMNAVRGDFKRSFFIILFTPLVIAFFLYVLCKKKMYTFYLFLRVCAWLSYMMFKLLHLGPSTKKKELQARAKEYKLRVYTLTTWKASDYELCVEEDSDDSDNESVPLKGAVPTPFQQCMAMANSSKHHFTVHIGGGDEDSDEDEATFRYGSSC